MPVVGGFVLLKLSIVMAKKSHVIKSLNRIGEKNTAVWKQAKKFIDIILVCLHKLSCWWQSHCKAAKRQNHADGSLEWTTTRILKFGELVSFAS